jgi:hypothetical protein
VLFRSSAGGPGAYIARYSSVKIVSLLPLKKT